MTESVGSSHPGMVRKLNEDSYGGDDQARIWVVADGLGGHNRGEVASELARDTVLSSFNADANLTDGIHRAHTAIREYVTDHRDCAGMGTTVVAATINDNNYEIAWVGDSRGYLYDDNLKQVTRDHSLVQALLDRGAIDEREAESHPERNVITRSLGDAANDILEVDLVSGTLKPGDLLLLCSDGLTNELSDSEIERELAADCSIQDKVNRLVSRALAAGGLDNITVLIIEYSEDSASGETDTAARESQTGGAAGSAGKLTPLLLVVAALLVLAVLFLEVFFAN